MVFIKDSLVTNTDNDYAKIFDLTMVNQRLTTYATVENTTLNSAVANIDVLREQSILLMEQGVPFGGEY